MKKGKVESLYYQIVKGETKKAKSKRDGFPGPLTFTFCLKKKNEAQNYRNRVDLSKMTLLIERFSYSMWTLRLISLFITSLMTISIS